MQATWTALFHHAGAITGNNKPDIPSQIIQYCIVTAEVIQEFVWGEIHGEVLSQMGGHLEWFFFCCQYCVIETPKHCHSTFSACIWCGGKSGMIVQSSCPWSAVAHLANEFLKTFAVGDTNGINSKLHWLNEMILLVAVPTKKKCSRQCTNHWKFLLLCSWGRGGRSYKYRRTSWHIAYFTQSIIAGNCNRATYTVEGEARIGYRFFVHVHKNIRIKRRALLDETRAEPYYYPFAWPGWSLRTLQELGAHCVFFFLLPAL